LSILGLSRLPIIQSNITYCHSRAAPAKACARPQRFACKAGVASGVAGGKAGRRGLVLFIWIPEPTSLKAAASGCEG